jgi:OOP family OmpA-OmpF porin
MKFLSKMVLLLAAFLFLFGCAAQQMNNIPPFQATKFDGNLYASKVDNFMIIFDASSSMYENYNGNKKFNIAQTLVQRMNQTIPELGQTAGLRSFGHSPAVSSKQTELFYGMEKFSSKNLSDKFKKVSEAGGTSPLFSALSATGKDLKDLSGKMNAVIIVSDGLENSGDAIAAAKALKALYGDAICFYPILVGASPEGEALFKEIAKIGGCGFASKADELLTSAGMAAFVEKVFLSKKDAPAAPAPTVKQRVDTDGDGVYDEDDKCPGTPKGARVNAQGCWVLSHVLFDFDKAEIKPMAYPLLDEVVAIFGKNPGMKVDLQGHCDNVGTPEYNMGLSLRRANAVKKYLVSKGVAENRLTTQGFGFSKPVGPNTTPEERSLNRRVELQPMN